MTGTERANRDRGGPVRSPTDVEVDHADHVNLIHDAVGSGGTWADFGAGTGAFTLALADLLGRSGCVVAIDRDRRSLATNRRRLRSLFPGFPALHLRADIGRRLPLHSLDGILLANVLHFQTNQAAVLEFARGYLRDAGVIAIVEYNIERSNMAVPHPVPFAAWRALAGQTGAIETTLLHRRPSRWHREIYSAVSRW